MDENKDKPSNIVEFIPREEWEKQLSATANSGGLDRPISLPRELNRRRVVSAFMDAFELLGGTPKLVLWAEENYTDFIKLYARLLPSQASQGLSEDPEKIIKHVLPRSALDE